MITTIQGKKPFTWSYSRLKNFEACPKKHWHVDLSKDYQEEKTDSLLWGDLAHKKLAERVGKGVPLPQGMEQYEHWCDGIAGGAPVLVEQKLAFTRDFAPCGYYDPDVWFRGVGDAIKLVPPVALAVDWKTGKIIEDSVQLGLLAQCIFCHYPSIQKIRTEFIWLKHNAVSREDFCRDDMPSLWRDLIPRVALLEQAYNTTTYEPKPGGLCKRWCPVKVCPYHGVGGE